MSTTTNDLAAQAELHAWHDSILEAYHALQNCAAALKRPIPTAAPQREQLAVLRQVYAALGGGEYGITDRSALVREVTQRVNLTARHVSETFPQFLRGIHDQIDKLTTAIARGDGTIETGDFSGPRPFVFFSPVAGPATVAGKLSALPDGHWLLTRLGVDERLQSDFGELIVLGNIRSLVGGAQLQPERSYLFAHARDLTIGREQERRQQVERLRQEAEDIKQRRAEFQAQARLERERRERAEAAVT